MVMFSKEWLAGVVRLRAGADGVDQRGKPIPGADVEEALPDCLFAPGGTSEPVAAGAAPVVSNPAAYWPGLHSVDVEPSDRLRINGHVYQVVGWPAVWPLGVQVELKGVENT